jgi:signal recognition particle subunit SRP54
MFDFLSEKFSSLFSSLTGSGQITEKNIESVLQQVQDTLIDADVPYDAATAFLHEVKKEVIGKKIVSGLKPSEQFVKIVHDKLLYFLGGQSTETTFSFQIPSMVMVMGLQGAGKTTTVAKLARFITDQAAKRGKQRRILIASVDFNRPAAIDQLEIMAQKVQAGFYRSTKSSPVEAALDIANYGKSHLYEIIILDTAGRLHIDKELMDELKAIDSLVCPKYKFLVLDAMIGQESLAVAQMFDKEIGFTGAILTKFDSQTRGGVALAFKHILKKPLLFIGTGEKVENFELFRPERLVKRILGMGDIASLVERAEEKIKHSEQEDLYKSIKNGKMTLRDFADQMSIVGKLGSLGDLMKYLPGSARVDITDSKVAEAEIELKKFKAIMGSMTKKEQLNYKLLDASRRKRISSGAGVQISDIEGLISRFEQSQQFIKLFKKMGRF